MEENNNVVLISITGDHLEGDERALYDEYLPKDTNPVEFIERLNRVVKAKRETREGELHVI